ncbi:30S ribosomal protein S6 [Durusdinium trenchii]|uniref:30S ribosomal protein S6 n=1 Tax=Durusdinium trenchii TaxID=1381693 RepID=A0ABP0K2L9_9DINO
MESEDEDEEESEDASDGQEEDEVDTDEEEEEECDGGEGEVDDADEEEEEEEEEEGDDSDGQSVEESNGDKLAAAAARTDAVAKKVRNSTTHKREWDKFSKSAKTKAFPIELAPHFKKNKNSLFGMWLDCGQEWDKVNIAVKQEQEQSHLARSQWEAIQVKDLRSKLSEPKFDELLKKRTADGLVYQDRDFPDDPEELWVYMPRGKIVRQDDRTSEKATLEAKTKVDEAGLAALTGDGGCFQPGALPSVVAATEAGAQKLLSALDDEKKSISRTKRAKVEKNDTEDLKPKLKNIEFAEELSGLLMKHATAMEGLYMEFQEKANREVNSEKDYVAVNNEWNKKDAWFQKAQVDMSDAPMAVGASVLLPHEVLHAFYTAGRTQVRDQVNETMAELVSWSLEQASRGIAPTTGFYGEEFLPTSHRAKLAGQTLAGGHKLCYFGFKADLKARKEAHHFARNYACLQMCERCDACQYKSNSTSEYSYKIMGPTARYADHLVSHEEYLATTSKISPWARVAGFQIGNATLDWMHLCYLGTAPSHIASCLKLLKHVGYAYTVGESDAMYLRRVSIEMRQTCKRHGKTGCK